MSFAIVGAAVAVAGVGAGLYGTISAQNQAEKNRRAAAKAADRGTISYPEFPAEATQLFRGVEQPLLQASLGEQQALLRPFMGGFDARQGLPATYGGAGQIAEAAGRAGAQGGGALGQVDTAIQGLTPNLLAALSQLVLQRGSQVQGVVPPGYGFAFAPSQRSKQGPPVSSAPAPVDPFATGAALGESLGTIGSRSFVDQSAY
jgi:hypothetical protein